MFIDLSIIKLQKGDSEEVGACIPREEENFPHTSHGRRKSIIDVLRKEIGKSRSYLYS